MADATTRVHTGQVPPHRLPESPLLEGGGGRSDPRGLTITFTVNRDGLAAFTDAHLAQLWHIAQANPAPHGDRDACDFAEAVGREIITRWLAAVPPELWRHQGRHVQRAAVLASEGRA